MSKLDMQVFVRSNRVNGYLAHLMKSLNEVPMALAAA